MCQQTTVCLVDVDWFEECDVVLGVYASESQAREVIGAACAAYKPEWSSDIVQRELNRLRYRMIAIGAAPIADGLSAWIG